MTTGSSTARTSRRRSARGRSRRSGRLKPNGQLTGYSPLSRVVELEGLALGITGKLALWKALRELWTRSRGWTPPTSTASGERAERQQAELEEHRLRGRARGVPRSLRPR